MADGDQQGTPITLFYSYSHDDEELRKRLEKHLSVLRWNGLIAEWHDRNIDLGDEWAKEIDRNLASADIILLLVSASFLASKYCWSVEMEKALERHDRGEAKVVPVILRHCQWARTRFAKLQAAPKDGKPVSSWPDQDEALNDVATRIGRIVADLQRQRQAVEEARPQAEREQRKRLQGQRERNEAKKQADAEARRIVEQERRSDRLTDFAVFRDVQEPWCPEMAALPAGEFRMGSLDYRRGSPTEKPQHQVKIGYRFALGRYPITFAEYDHFCAATRRDKPDASCLVPGFDGALFSPAWRDALWARFFTAAPPRQRRSVEQYNIVKRA